MFPWSRPMRRTTRLSLAREGAADYIVTDARRDLLPLITLAI
jgi:hypothetical protein